MEKVMKFFCIFGIVALLFCFSNSPSFAQVKVGVMFSTTGGASAVGKIQMDGINLAVKQFNDRGGGHAGRKKSQD